LKSKFVITATLPGVKNKNIQASLDGNTLVIRARRTIKLRKGLGGKCDCEFHFANSKDQRVEVWNGRFDFPFKPNMDKSKFVLHSKTDQLRITIPKPKPKPPESSSKEKQKQDEGPVDCKTECQDQWKRIQTNDISKVKAKVTELNSRYVITAKLPKVKRKDVKAKSARNAVIVEGKRSFKLKKGRKDKCSCDFHTVNSKEKRREVWQERFEFEFTPNPQKIIVSLNPADDMLRLTIQKPKEYKEFRKKIREKERADGIKRSSQPLGGHKNFDVVRDFGRTTDSSDDSHRWFDTFEYDIPPDECDGYDGEDTIDLL